MSATQILLIRCDGPDCGAEWGSPDPADTHTELRAYLRTRGWARRRSGGRVADLCPDCAVGDIGRHHRDAPPTLRS
ncbi:hypothetical protein ACWGIB_27545 [Streptomyces xiamenensis]